MYPPSNWSNINRRHQNLYQVEYISSNNYVKSRYVEPSNYSRERQSRPSYNPSQYLSKINVPPSRGRTTIRPDSSVRYKSKKSTKSIDQDFKPIQIPNKPSSKYRKDRAEYQINDKIPTFKNSTNASFNSIPTNNQSIPIYRPRVVNQQTGQHIENHNKGNRSNTVVKKMDIEIRKAINEQINGEELRRSHSENKADEEYHRKFESIEQHCQNLSKIRAISNVNKQLSKESEIIKLETRKLDNGKPDN